MNFKIDIPPNIQVQIHDQDIHCEGPLGSLTILRKKLDPKAFMLFQVSNSAIHFCSIKNSISSKIENSYEGNIKAIFNQTFQGLIQGYLIHLELVGVGFRVTNTDVDNQLDFKLGFSHPIFYQLPNDVRAIISKPTELSLYGIDSNRLTQIAANIKKLRVPDAYQGKGIRRSSDILHLKEMKKS